MDDVISVIQWIVTGLAMALIQGLLPDKALRVLRAVGGVAMGIGAILLLLGVAIMFTIEDDLGFFLGLFVGSISFLFLMIGSSLRAIGDDDDGQYLAVFCDIFVKDSRPSLNRIEAMSLENSGRFVRPTVPRRRVPIKCF